MRALPDPRERVWTILKWCSACGHDRVLDHLLRTEGANVTPDLLNGKCPPKPRSHSNSPPASVDQVVIEHTLPIHLASIGSAESVELLALDGGADVNAGDSKGNTAAGIAAHKGFLDAVEVRTTRSPSILTHPLRPHRAGAAETQCRRK
jgi:ankyrin repeat protein